MVSGFNYVVSTVSDTTKCFGCGKEGPRVRETTSLSALIERRWKANTRKRSRAHRKTWRDRRGQVRSNMRFTRSMNSHQKLQAKRTTGIRTRSSRIRKILCREISQFFFY